MTQFKFSPPPSVATEKVKLDLSPDTLAWADGIASGSGCSRELVLEQAVAYAVASTRRKQPKKKAE